MRRSMVVLAAALLALAAAPGSAGAQLSTAAVPAESVTVALGALHVSEDSVRLNGRYVRGDVTIAAGDTVRGPLVVIGGTAEILGVVAGDVHTLWGDVVVRQGARREAELDRLEGFVVIGHGGLPSPFTGWSG